MTIQEFPTAARGRSVRVLTDRVDLRTIFVHEEAFTQWLAVEGWSEFCASLGIDAVSVKVIHQAVTAAGRIADVVAAADEDGHYSAVVEAQLGAADHDHARRLVADYMGAFHPGVGVLLAERWNESVEAILSNSLRPILGVEAAAHRLGDDDYVLMFTVVHRHDPQGGLDSVVGTGERLWINDDVEFAALVVSCCERGVTTVPAIIRDLHHRGIQAGGKRVLRFIPEEYLPAGVKRPTDPNERRYIPHDDEFRQAVLNAAGETGLTKVWQIRNALNDRLIQASHRRIATVLGLDGDSGEWDAANALRRINEEATLAPTLEEQRAGSGAYLDAPLDGVE
jgi:hypothetical protein